MANMPKQKAERLERKQLREQAKAEKRQEKARCKADRKPAAASLSAPSNRDREDRQEGQQD